MYNVRVVSGLSGSATINFLPSSSNLISTVRYHVIIYTKEQNGGIRLSFLLRHLYVFLFRIQNSCIFASLNLAELCTSPPEHLFRSNRPMRAFVAHVRARRAADTDRTDVPAECSWSLLPVPLVWPIIHFICHLQVASGVSGGGFRRENRGSSPIYPLFW